MKQLFTLLLLAFALGINAQAPQSIPYQAVVRNSDGSPMASTSVTMILSIHNLTAAGDLVYKETHSTTTNTQGLVSLSIGSGTPVTGNFSAINWGSGAKFLQVAMNAGNGNIDLGTQQLMSVPYALYAEDVNVRVSATGDTLTLGGSSLIVPGVSNSTNGTSYHYVQGTGVTDIDGNFYPSVIINGKEWMSENLKVTKFNNGTSINYSANWSSGSGGYTYYNYDVSNKDIYGALYRSSCIHDIYANPEQLNICPTGWRLPRKLDFMHLLCSLDDSIYMIGSHDNSFSNKVEYLLDITGGGLSQNIYGFNVKLGGYVSSSFSNFSPLNESYLWTSDILITSYGAGPVLLGINDQSLMYSGLPVVLGPSNTQFDPGFYIRCVKDN